VTIADYHAFIHAIRHHLGTFHDYPPKRVTGL
jgi:hypothetical protein